MHGFLDRYGLEGEYKVNIEANHATLAGHSFHHEVAYAVANGIFGSIDANRGDPQNGWDTDQFPNSVEDLALPLYEILPRRRLHHRRLQLRRQAAPPEHRPDRPVPRPHRRDRHARPGAAGRRRHDRARGRWRRMSEARYAGWDGPLGHGDPRRRARASPTSRRSVAAGEIDPRPVSGRQELLENVVNRHIWAVDRAGGAADRTRWAVVLGIDVSTTATKALLRRRRPGAVLRHRRRGLPASSVPRPLWSEQDPHLWWDGTIDGDRGPRSRQRASPATTSAAVGLTGQMHGAVLLDAADEVLRPAILWNDQRTGAECDADPGARSARSGSSRSPATTP